ncbi:hypothetical protein FKM82_006033 [Ascaphus truei]
MFGNHVQPNAVKPHQFMCKSQLSFSLHPFTKWSLQIHIFHTHLLLIWEPNSRTILCFFGSLSLKYVNCIQPSLYFLALK